MIDIWIVLYIILIHNIADFWLQTKEQAMNKSHDITKLLDHTVHYSYLMLALCIPIFNDVWDLIIFIIFTFIIHTITDFNTSKLSKKYYDDGKYYGVPGFWFIISVDQILHYIQLLLIYYALQLAHL